MSIKIYIFRHGQTTYNRDGRFTGITDAKLTKKGIEDAKIIAERLKNKKIHIAYCTKLSRSKETLKEVLHNHPECKLLVTDNRLIERNYGRLNGKTHYEIVKKYGTEKYDAWHRSYTHRPPKGESFADVEKRVKEFVNNLKKLAKGPTLTVAISAHGNSIRLFRKIMEHLTIKETIALTIPYDKYYEYEILSKKR